MISKAVTTVTFTKPDNDINREHGLDGVRNLKNDKVV